ncbi:hypothetical protein CR513_08986, partial [Mucuna pruriens]
MAYHKVEPTPIRNQIRLGSRRPTLQKARSKHIIYINQARIPCQFRSSDCVSHQLAWDECSTIVVDNPLFEPEPMENNNKTLKELAMPDSELIHLLPKFHDLTGKDPNKHLKEFCVVFSTMRPQGIPEDYIKMKAFPFSLDGVAKEWLYLQLVMFTT